MNNIRVVSSYLEEQRSVAYADFVGKKWIKGFVSTLIKNGYSLNDFDFQFIELPDSINDTETLFQEFVNDNVQLIICAGNDSVYRLAAINRTIPMLYFGTHPENNGLEIIDKQNISGVRLNLPLIWSLKNFSILKRLLPDLEEIYIPIYLLSEFDTPNVRVNHELFRAQKKGFWIPGHSSYIGYKSIHFLSESLGCRYYECPYITRDELETCLGQINPEKTALIGFNDTTLLKGGVDLVLNNTRRNGIPVFWVNNFSIVKAGGVADFSSDFERVGKLIGSMSLQLLRDNIPIEKIMFREDPAEKFSLNLKTCREMSIHVSQEILDSFHVIEE
ncbi:hypothetical protein SCALIN_C29_0005 [Candidatus Scalindua japonica]|uniref:Uncharacterized protein n=1 Tax=Candidatus Scalindua japonica TaxID=1284222 RepID=A0A286U271_9BACT|nr:hypothetical protein [Candidatus Scalindua japonica]GAX62226.1 hypothetical protein SCALIN_C29_0005 [Candidatus Scalindua japonica]